MKEYYFTFGHGHFSLAGKRMLDSWVRVTAPDYETAREHFRQHFAQEVMGNPDRWAFQYDESNFNPHYCPEGEYEHLTVTT